MNTFISTELGSSSVASLPNRNSPGYGPATQRAGILVLATTRVLEGVRGLGASGVTIEDMVESLDPLGNESIRFTIKKWHSKPCELFKWKLKSSVLVLYDVKCDGQSRELTAASERASLYDNYLVSMTISNFLLQRDAPKAGSSGNACALGHLLLGIQLILKFIDINQINWWYDINFGFEHSFGNRFCLALKLSSYQSTI